MTIHIDIQRTGRLFNPDKYNLNQNTGDGD